MNLTTYENKVSIIVPVYNVERYLEGCLDSIKNQTYTNIEVILVNDGSTDKSLEICQRYAAMDARFIVIDQENQGVSAARNQGIERVTGEWIFFQDSDDMIDCHAIEVLMSQTVGTNDDACVDVVVCNHVRIYAGQPLVPCRMVDVRIERYQTGCDFYRATSDGKDRQYYLHANLPWAKLYRKALWEKIRFPVGKIHEDEWTIYKVLAPARTIVFTQAELYYYLVRENSIMTSSYAEKNLSVIEALQERIGYFVERKEWEIASATTTELMRKAIQDYYTTQNQTIREILYAQITATYREYKAWFGWKRRIRYQLFLISPKLYDCLHQMYMRVPHHDVAPIARE